MALKRKGATDRDQQQEAKFKKFKLSIEKTLQEACSEGNIKIVKQCLKLDLDLNGRDSYGMTPLHLASEGGHDEIVAELLKQNVNIDDKNKIGFTALHIASKNGFVKIVAMLLQYGAKIDLYAGNKPEGCNGCDLAGPPCYPDGNALFLASGYGHVDVVKLLLKNGSSTISKCSHNFIDIACENGHIEVMRELVRNGAKINKQVDCWDNFPPLHKTVANNGKIEVIQELVRLGANINLFYEYMGTPINIAARDGNLTIVKELLKLGADPYQDFDEEDSLDYETPLHGALSKGHHSIVEEILLYHENDAILNDMNNTPLHFAADVGNTQALKKLLARGCNVEMKGSLNRTPLHYAVSSACAYCERLETQLEAMSLLLKHGADVNAQDDVGDTTLHTAIREHNLYCTRGTENTVLEKLLKEGSGIDFNLKNKHGKTALQLAFYLEDINSARMIAKMMIPNSRITHSIYPLECFL